MTEEKTGKTPGDAENEFTQAASEYDAYVEKCVNEAKVNLGNVDKWTAFVVGHRQQGKGGSQDLERVPTSPDTPTHRQEDRLDSYVLCCGDWLAGERYSDDLKSHSEEIRAGMKAWKSGVDLQELMGSVNEWDFGGHLDGHLKLRELKRFVDELAVGMVAAIEELAASQGAAERSQDHRCRVLSKYVSRRQAEKAPEWIKDILTGHLGAYWDKGKLQQDYDPR